MYIKKKSAIIIIFILAVIFFFPVIFQNKTFYAFDSLFDYLPWSSLVKNFRSQNTLITDPINVFYPVHNYYQRSLESPNFPLLWNPSNFCGTSFLYYSSPFFFIFFSFFPLTIAHDLLLLFHITAAGIMTYLYLEKIGLRPISCLIGAISWMFNGYVMVWFEFEHIPMIAFPLVGMLYFIEVWIEKRTTISFLCLICMIALSISGAHAQLFLYQMLFVIFYSFYRFISEKNIVYMVFKLILAFVISSIISLNFFISNFLNYKDGQRQNMPYSELFGKTGQVMPKYLITLLFPDTFGNPAKEIAFTPYIEKSQRYNTYNELCLYTGIFSLLLSLACIPFLWKEKHIIFFIISAIICLLISMGSFIYYPFAKIIPGLGLSTPTRVLYLFGFSISILSAFGANIIQTQIVKEKKIILTIWIILVIISISFALFVQTDEGRNFMVGGEAQWNKWMKTPLSEAFLNHFNFSSDIILKPLLIILTSFLILTCILYSPIEKYKNIMLLLGIILLSYDLISFALIYNTASPRNLEYPKTPAISFLQNDQSKFRIAWTGLFLHNGFLPFGIEDVSGYSSFYPKRYGEFIHLSQHGNNNVQGTFKLNRWLFLNKFNSPLLDLINTKYILAPPFSESRSEKLKAVYDGEIKIFENTQVFPRIFFVKNYIIANNSQKAYEFLSKFSREDFLDKVILEELPPKSFIGNNSCNNKEKINIISYNSDRIELEIVAGCNGFIVISDFYDSNWNGTIDGNKIDILRANYILRAIPVTEGKHKVILTYIPNLLIFSNFITIIGWVVLFISIIKFNYAKK